MYIGMNLCRFKGGYVYVGRCGGNSGASGYSTLTGSKFIKSHAVIL